MRILLIGNYLKDEQQSMQRFTNILFNNLKKEKITVKLIYPKNYFGKITKSNTGIGKWLGYIDKYILFPIIIKKQSKRFDLIHIIDHSNSLYYKYIKKPCLITCHDLLAIKSALNKTKNKTKLTGKILQKWILNSLKKAEYIVCDSIKTKNDLLEFNKKSKVIYLGLNYPYKPIKTKIKYSNYFIHVGNNNWYKNRLGVLKIFNKLPNKYNLIMVGKPFTKDMKSFIKNKKLSKRVVQLTNISNKELNNLYSNAKALIFPSFEEGFGWPIIEAQASGCLVFTTNKPPMNEISNKGAIYFNDINDTNECARLIIDNLKNKKKINNIKKIALNNLKKFSKNKMIKEYITIYKEIIHKNIKACK